jgi:hypothetical protein
MELWSAHNEKALIALDIRTMDESPLTAAEINLHLPSVRLAGVRGSAQVIECNESYIRRHPMGIIGVFFALKGEAFFYHPSGVETLRPGQAVFYDVDRPFIRGFHSGVEEMVLTIPARRFCRPVGRQAADTARRLQLPRRRSGEPPHARVG